MANPLLYAAKENPFSLALKPIPKFFFVSCTQWQGVFFFILTNGGQLVFPYTYATIIGEQIGNFRTFFYPPLLSFFLASKADIWQNDVFLLLLSLLVVQIVCIFCG